jgi:hypothetical protein
MKFLSTEIRGDSKRLFARCGQRAMLAAIFLMTSIASAATQTAKPGDDLQQLVRKLRPGDELVLADGNYANVSIDFGRVWNVTVRAENSAQVKIDRDEKGQPRAKPASGVVLSGKGKPFVFRGGSDITLIGFTVDGCSNTLQQGAIQRRVDVAGPDRPAL